jgi:hypothetical protein
VKPWPYASFGEPGVVKSREYVADLDVTLVEFENGREAHRQADALQQGPGEHPRPHRPRPPADADERHRRL